MLPLLEKKFGESVFSSLENQAGVIQENITTIEAFAKSYFDQNLSPLTFGSREWMSEIKRCLGEAPPRVSALVIRKAFRHLHDKPLTERAIAQIRSFLLSGTDSSLNQRITTAVQPGLNLEIRRKNGGISVSSLYHT